MLRFVNMREAGCAARTVAAGADRQGRLATGPGAARWEQLPGIYRRA